MNLNLVDRRRAARIERLEIATRMHAVFARNFACFCGDEVTAQVSRKMTYDGRFCDGVVATCANGHTCEYWL